MSHDITDERRWHPDGKVSTMSLNERAAYIADASGYSQDGKRYSKLRARALQQLCEVAGEKP